MRNKWKIFSFLILLTVLVLAGCGSKDTDDSKDSTESASVDRDTIVIGLDSDPPQLDPHKSSAGVDRQVYHSVFNKLIEIDENWEFVPQLATSWDESEDGLTYILELRDDVTFHDGTKFDAEAVKFNFDRMLDPDFGSARAAEINSVDKVEVVDEFTVKVTLKEPYAPFLSMLTDRAGMILSPTAIQEMGDDFSNHPVGTGPYKFVNRVKDEKIELEVFEDYWGEKPQVPNVVIRTFPDPDIRFTNLTSGDVDIINKIAFKDIERVEDDPNMTVSEMGGLGYQALFLNTETAPFDNKAVRQAVNLAIDRKAIAEVVFKNRVSPATQAFPSDSWAYNENLEVPDADPEKAKALLEEAGIDEVSFTLKLREGTEEEQMAEMIQSMLKQANINMDIEIVEFGKLLEELDNGDFQAARSGWIRRTDPDGDVYRFLKTGQTNNYTNYSDETVDKLLDDARKESDQDKRKAMYNEISEIIWENAHVIFLYNELEYKAMKSHLKGFKHLPDSMIRTETIYFE